MDLRKVVRRGIQIGAMSALALALTAGAAYADGYSIQGHVNHADGDWAGSAISAVLYQNISSKWTPVGGSTVATDGSYSIDGVADGGTYRVGFTDANHVYGDVYYQDATAVGTASDINVASATVSAVDQTVTALPNRQITGQVSFVNAPAVSGDVQAEVYSLDASGTWNVVYTMPVNDDGTYDVHVTADGTYRVGFSDASRLFPDAFYNGASTVASATDVAVVAGTPATGINGTLTATPSVRLGDTDPISSAIAISQANYADGVGGTVIVAGADSALDALTAAPLARALNAPILLVHKSSVDASVTAELGRLDPDEVIIIGGASTVSVPDEMAIRATGISVVRRLAGTDRYGTSVAIAQEMLNRGMVLYDETGSLMNVAVATGASANDALVAAPLAADQQMPLLLIQKAKVPTVVSDFLAASETSATQVLAIGGPNSIADSTLDMVSIAPSGGVAADNVERVGDSDSYRTSVAAASHAMDSFGWSARMVALASAKDPQDLVTVGPLLAANQEAVLLTAPALTTPKKVAYSPKPYGHTQLTPAVEVFISKVTTPAIDPAGVGFDKTDPTEYSNVLRDFNIGKIDAIGANDTANGGKYGLPDAVWNYAKTVAGVH